MFLKLFCAVIICSSSVYRTYLPLARQLFIDFIENHIEIHGESSITINIHNLSHVVDDVEMFGPLYTISAYEFENCLYQIKLKRKQCSKPLQQVACRVSEVAAALENTGFELKEKFPQLDYPFQLPENHLAYRLMKYKPGVTLSSAHRNKKDNWFLTSNNRIVEFHFITEDRGRLKIRGSALKKMYNFFQQPFDSKRLNIFLSDGEKHNAEYFDINTIKAKMFCLPI